jgi:hypothetical protein
MWQKKVRHIRANHGTFRNLRQQNDKGWRTALMSAQHTFLAILTHSNFHGIVHTEMTPTAGSHIRTVPNTI